MFCFCFVVLIQVFLLYGFLGEVSGLELDLRGSEGSGLFRLLWWLCGKKNKSKFRGLHAIRMTGGQNRELQRTCLANS